MTPNDRAEAVSTLLSEAEQAHGVYESAQLSGVYDQDWPSWYASYAVEHGLGELVGHDVRADQLAAFLARTFEEFTTTEPRPSQAWAAWTAERIRREL
jgi:hypothetical protein